MVCPTTKHLILRGSFPTPTLLLLLTPTSTNSKTLFLTTPIDDWTAFEDLVQDFICCTQKENWIHFQSQQRVRPKPNQKDNPSFIQRLYRRNRRRVVRLIKEDTKPQCDSLREKFFSATIPEVDLSVYVDSPAANPANDKPFLISEVFEKLKRCENTAIGPYRLTFFHLQKVNVEAKVLTLIFNYCLKAKKIPKAWKVSKTVFIPKAGNPFLPQNWCPVLLSSTIYKLFASLVAKRITEWIETHEVLSKCQKGFRPFHGTIENNYILSEHIQDCRRKRKDLCLMLIDVKNAF